MKCLIKYLLFNLFIFLNCYSQIRIINKPVSTLQDPPVIESKEIKYPVFHKDAQNLDSLGLYGDLLFYNEEENIRNNKAKITLYNGITWIYVKALDMFNQEHEAISCWVKESDTQVLENFVIPEIISVIKNNWVNNLSIGTKLLTLINDPDKFNIFDIKTAFNSQNLDEKLLRENILKTAQNFLGMPYSWGGKSAWDGKGLNDTAEMQTSVDCSGFINLIYRVNGLEIPRNSGTQYKYCNKINKGLDLLPGDLIFLTNPTSGNINHVILYLGNNLMQESIGSENPEENRITEFNKRFGKNISETNSGDFSNVIEGQKIYFGSLLNSQEKLEEMRKYFFFTKNLIKISYFNNISKELENFITGKSFKPNFPIKIEDLAVVYTLYWGFDNLVYPGQIIVNKSVAKDVCDIFQELFDAHFRIEKISLIDNYNADDDLAMADNNSSSLCCRAITGKPGTYSKHTFGLAIDINPVQNPYVKGKLVLPENSKNNLNNINYTDRDAVKNLMGVITQDSVCYKIFAKYGWTWGGNWDKTYFDGTENKRYFDYQHFEK
ncbi:C40 family peptidase [Candidatus Dependentiae bacterium]|nr:C40 family peptidase [Candidatus Dependentiae bacterium]MBU4387144.1 C40 family peptidase [Candidatus Dependentiae bacterium]MCG2756731.1 NlpC/P60 family protein [Candidatus Dependentiae bacterium]